MNNWINVEIALPPKMEGLYTSNHVLCQDGISGKMVCYYMHDEKIWILAHGFRIDGTVQEVAVKKWMYLPE